MRTHFTHTSPVCQNNDQLRGAETFAFFTKFILTRHCHRQPVRKGIMPARKRPLPSASFPSSIIKPLNHSATALPSSLGKRHRRSDQAHKGTCQHQSRSCTWSCLCPQPSPYRCSLGMRSKHTCQLHMGTLQCHHRSCRWSCWCLGSVSCWQSRRQLLWSKLQGS